MEVFHTTLIIIFCSYGCTFKDIKFTLSSNGASRAAARSGPLLHFQTSFTEDISSTSLCSYRDLKSIHKTNTFQLPVFNSIK